MRTEVEINDKVYPTLREACNDLGISHNKARRIAKKLNVSTSVALEKYVSGEAPERVISKRYVGAGGVFGRDVYQLRLEKNETVMSFAKRIGVSSSTISHWEAGQCLPSGEHLVKLAIEFGMTEQELVKKIYNLKY